ncbi:endolytic transglycosylase MltG [Nakamurella sp. YIM 132087]|uniref:Endolytic murein transglycosylase n=1 Tax=Nakamurella alba TaxID=2665158 RepID=A0A7K1FT22_9ACTN|nr:endolytic transglycosylase MltG [Nakamurella alba]MTD17306.1 endolytic transglycosylase MltG [Nakamurella alba]
MNDHLGIFDGPDRDRDRSDDTGNVDVAELRKALTRTAGTETPKAAAPSPVTRREAQRQRREAQARRNRKRRRHSLLALVILLVIAGGITGGFLIWRHNADVVPDFAGAPGPQTVIRVQSGDSRDDIAGTLAAAGVVASAQAFLDATAGDADVAALPPGYFRLQTALPAHEAANQLVAEQNRVGHIRIIPGRRLADVSTKSGGGGTVTEGYLSQIAAAACVPLDGKSDCWPVQDLWTVAETADPVELGVPDWAVNAVQNAPEPDKRLEGLIVPGEYDIPANASPLDTLKAVLTASSATFAASDIVTDSRAAGLDTYQTLTIASIVERESNTVDMPKVARVVENRIQDRMKLQMDSTVNYFLDRAQISTTKEERATSNPWNTYAVAGLPPTPISSPGPDALEATVAPTEGPWLFFVKIDTAGNSCFSVTNAEHEKCVAEAQQNGVFDE